jgi:hypothetical protein
MNILRNIFKKRSESGFVNQSQQKRYVPNFDNMTEFGNINSTPTFQQYQNIKEQRTI